MQWLRKIDPMVRLIVAAMVLATLLPVKGEAAEIAKAISNGAVFLLFFFYGLRLPRGEVLAGLGNMRLLVPLMLWVFGGMALAGWAAWRATLPLLPATMALGFLYQGVLPSTVQSATVYCSLARGNVASSVVAAALLNIAGVFLSVPLFSLLAGSGSSAFHGDTLVKVLTMLLLPFVVGQALQVPLRGFTARYRPQMAKLDRLSIGIAVYVAFSGAVVSGVWREVDAVSGVIVLAATAVLLVVGYGGAWMLGAALSLPRGDRISMLFAGAQKSIAMGAPLATVLFPPAIAGTILLPLLAYHLAQMIVAAPIAARLARQAEDG